MPETATPMPGLIGSYRVRRVVGRGGMGTVYEAVQEKLKLRVAIKVLHPRFSTLTEVRRRFEHEAVAANSIDHPDVVKIHESGTLPDGGVYLVMDYLEGKSLRQRMREGLTLTDMLRIGRHIARVLAAAHAANVVHRDLKPENIMLVPDRETPLGVRVKVLDFGIARILAPDSPEAMTRMTQTGVIVGTATYMAPEQCRAMREIDGRADVYALGVILYEALATRPPYVEETPNDVLIAQVRDPLPPLPSFAPMTPLPVVELIHRMLRKRPAERPSMAEVVVELERLAEMSNLASPEYAAISVMSSDPSSHHSSLSLYSTMSEAASQPKTRRKPSWVPSNKQKIIAAGVGAALLSGVLSWILISMGPKSKESTSAGVKGVAVPVSPGGSTPDTAAPAAPPGKAASDQAAAPDESSSGTVESTHSSRPGRKRGHHRSRASEEDRESTSSRPTSSGRTRASTEESTGRSDAARFVPAHPNARPDAQGNQPMSDFQIREFLRQASIASDAPETCPAAIDKAELVMRNTRSGDQSYERAKRIKAKCGQ